MTAPMHLSAACGPQGNAVGSLVGLASVKMSTPGLDAASTARPRARNLEEWTGT
jgi:hypothetical protein